MIRIGTLKDYKDAQRKLHNAGFDVTEPMNGNLVRKTLVDGDEAVSIAKLRGNTWVFKYNPKYFKE